MTVATGNSRNAHFRNGEDQELIFPVCPHINNAIESYILMKRHSKGLMREIFRMSFERLHSLLKVNGRDKAGAQHAGL